MRLLYSFSIYFYQILIQIASLTNPKAKLWIRGRKNVFQKLRIALNNETSEIIWFHCASLGEFEQARPLIEKIKNFNSEGKTSQQKILLTFFSPSGFEIKKNYLFADFIFYLPIDTPKNTKKFIEIVKPTKAFFIKYEFWFNYLRELKQQNIPTFLVSGIFRKNQYFFKSNISWFREQLACFTHFYLQDVASVKLLNSIEYYNTSVAGDTRFDRVFESSITSKKVPFVDIFKNGNDIIIVGSSWEEDETILSRLNALNSKIIIAPHEINEQHINSIIKKFSNYTLSIFSTATKKNLLDSQILLIDNVGLLSSIYSYGNIAIIGGGFGKGIHNILEAATFGLPVIFGPNYKKFIEAKELIELGGAFVIKNSRDLEKILLQMKDETFLNKASIICKEYVKSKIGATDIIINDLFK